MVKNTAAYLHETFGAQIVEVSINFPTSDDLIVQVRCHAAGGTLQPR